MPIEWATAMMARFFPRREAQRRDRAAREVSLVPAAAGAHGVRPVRRAPSPWRVFPERGWPARSAFPDAPPLRTARREAVPKRAIAIPHAATNRAPPPCVTPGMVSMPVTARAKARGGGREVDSAPLPRAPVAPSEAAGGGVGGREAGSLFCFFSCQALAEMLP
jgi:hypothetical protein